MHDEKEAFQDKRIQGGILQYVHQSTDLDSAILVLRERNYQDFLIKLMEVLDVALKQVQEQKALELAACIVHFHALVYPDTITQEQVHDYEVKY